MRQRDHLSTTFGPGNEGFEINYSSADEQDEPYFYGDEDDGYGKLKRKRQDSEDSCWCVILLTVLCSLDAFEDQHIMCHDSRMPFLLAQLALAQRFLLSHKSANIRISPR